MTFYFVFAYLFSWIFAIVMFGLIEVQTEGDFVLGLATAGFTLIGPTLSAFVMTAATQGRPGTRRLVDRYKLFRVARRWYAFVLLVPPLALFLGFLAIPGGPAAFDAVSPLEAVITYIPLFVVIFFIGGPFGEEPGWRGFALPRMQRAYGPVISTMTLGVLWGIWHLPLFLFIPGYNGAGSDVAGIVAPFLALVIVSTAISFVFTWVFNNVGGSLLLMMLLHASFNTGTSTIPALFPRIPADGVAQVLPMLIAVAAALIVILATRGFLGYARYRSGAESLDLAPAADVGQATAHVAGPRSRRVLAIVMGAILVASGATVTALAWDPTGIAGSFAVGGRSLYLACSGDGGPTIVMESGSGGDHTAWSAVVPDIRGSNRICTYDRANTGASSPVGGTLTSTDVVRDLHELLAAANVAPPYILVGHSLGGISVRLFASTYPAEIVGLVMVDATPITFLDDACSILDASQCAMFREDFEPRNNDGVDIEGSATAIRAAGPLPAVPLVVLAASDHGQQGSPAGRRFEARWVERQQQLADSVPGGRLVVVASGHNIASQHPEAVVDAIRSVLTFRSGVVVP